MMKTNDYKRNFYNVYVYNIYDKIKFLKNLIIEFKKLLNEKINKPLVISGPSAVGKDTMINRLIIKYPDVINKLPSYTTRPKREGEIEGKDYYFVSKEKFLKMKDEGMLFGIQEYNNNFYASNKKELKEALEENKKIIVLNYNIETAYAVKDEIDFNFVALLPPNEDELRKRLIKRAIINIFGLFMSIVISLYKTAFLLFFFNFFVCSLILSPFCGFFSVVADYLHEQALQGALFSVEAAYKNVCLDK